MVDLRSFGIGAKLAEPSCESLFLGVELMAAFVHHGQADLGSPGCLSRRPLVCLLRRDARAQLAAPSGEQLEARLSVGGLARPLIPGSRDAHGDVVCLSLE